MNRLLLIPLLIFVSCASGKFKIQSSTIAEADYSRYSSFKYYNPDNLPKSNFTFNESQQKLLFDLIAAELKNKGFTSHRDADLIIKVQGGTENVETSQSNRNYQPYYGPYYYNRYDYQDFRDRSEKFTTIIVDVLDAKSNKLLWQGVAYGPLAKNSEEQTERIRQAVQEIFLEFPIEQTNHQE